MSQFQVGDSVVLDRNQYPRMMQHVDKSDINFGLIFSISLSTQTCRIRWDHGLEHTYALAYVRLYIGDYEDFLDKIKDRIGPKLDQ